MRRALFLFTTLLAGSFLGFLYVRSQKSGIPEFWDDPEPVGPEQDAQNQTITFEVRDPGNYVPEDYLTLKEAADFLEIKPRSLRSYHYNDRLNADLVVNKDYFYDIDTLRTYQRQRELNLSQTTA